MYFHQPDTSHIRQQLLDLQRGYPSVEGLMLVSSGGIVLASTFQKPDNVSRLAAVTRTLFLLADEACTEMGRGQMQSVHLSYKRGMGGDDNAPSQVTLVPVGGDIVLMMVLHAGHGTAMSPSPALHSDVQRLIQFIAHQIAHNA